MCAKHYENTTMLFRVSAKNVGDVFWDTVYVEKVQRIVCRQKKLASLYYSSNLQTWTISSARVFWNLQSYGLL